MKIFKPASFNEQGNRPNNEDSIYPASATSQQRLFMVCDGVGGQEKGELASGLLCKHFARYITDHKPVIQNKEIWTEALRYAEQKFVNHLQGHEEDKGMASTFTMLYLFDKENKAMIGWIGDSRVYHIRDGKILFRTKDHSEVQNLINMGEITEEEARTHPRKNVITRAVNGVVPGRMDLQLITDIQPDDFFFLVTDGVLENLSEDFLSKTFRRSKSPDSIKGKLLENAQGRTRDNFSMFLIKVEETITSSKRDAVPLPGAKPNYLFRLFRFFS